VRFGDWICSGLCWLSAAAFALAGYFWWIAGCWPGVVVDVVLTAVWTWLGCYLAQSAIEMNRYEVICDALADDWLRYLAEVRGKHV
jgi:hypothetical protein